MKGSFTHNGKNYNYEFKFYVNTEIRGSDNCLEWGVYDPSSVDIYYIIHFVYKREFKANYLRKHTFIVSILDFETEGNTKADSPLLH